MKIAITGILIILLITGFGLYFSQTLLQEQTVPKTKPDIVYVNIDELLDISDATRFSADLRAGIRFNNSVSGAFGICETFDYGLKPTKAYTDLLGILRSDAINQAYASLADLDKQRRTALDLRVADMRESLLRDRRIRTDTQLHEIDQASVEKKRRIADNYTNSYLNAQLKLAALERRKSVEYSESEQTQKIADARSELERIEQARKNEMQLTDKEAREQMRLVLKKASEAVDDEVSVYEHSDIQRIEQASANARDYVQSQIYDDAISRKELNINRAMLTLKDYGEKKQTPEINDRSGTVKNKIRKDIGRAVRIAAAKEGLKVVFTPMIGVKDYTAYFAERIYPSL